ncbi:hypothetical protein Q9L42_020930 (plasmid) [Methylomarinum sp. Ch1-1]|uniref:Methyl-accepting chemotaxis protein n=1 Tax=Methylomarinum roseum TaxID=3067653 RepID=A0AAU7P0K0_9GAMM|nr:hypothetical protein [Methylomarinum sp. Ch1-1]MDP4518989.1 hypothetical protein [Methylomarinum sp. Ch1-1]MDP4523387.1 hypothetical protein [Methylomarinum sp. Ch1-1]
MDIRVQKLFVIALILKIGLSGIGWFISDPWIFGLVFPLSVMGLYIVLGMHRSNDDISDDKFADSCYYLGFIFTITSIIFSLFDLPDIETKMSEIAVRFGVAMVSTVIGLAVRVYLVSFKHDFNDAMIHAEDSVIDATTRLSEQLRISLENLQEFDSRVDEATKTTLTNVAVGVEQLTESYGNKLSLLFEDLSSHNKEAFESTLNEVKDSTNRLADSVDLYSSSLRTNLGSIEDKVTMFADVVTKRLEETTFPDDYFSKQLNGPIKRLSLSTDKMAEHVAQVAIDVSSSTEGISSSLARLRSRSDEIGDALERVTELAGTQEQILYGTQSQVETLSVLSSTLRVTQQNIGKVSESMIAQTKLYEQHIAEQKGQSSSLAVATTELASLRESWFKTNESDQTLNELIIDVLSGITKQNENVTNGLEAIQKKLVEQHESAKEAHIALNEIVLKLDGIVNEVPSFKDLLDDVLNDRKLIGQRQHEHDSVKSDLHRQHASTLHGERSTFAGSSNSKL